MLQALAIKDDNRSVALVIHKMDKNSFYSVFGSIPAVLSVSAWHRVANIHYQETQVSSGTFQMRTGNFNVESHFRRHLSSSDDLQEQFLNFDSVASFGPAAKPYSSRSSGLQSHLLDDVVSIPEVK